MFILINVIKLGNTPSNICVDYVKNFSECVSKRFTAMSLKFNMHSGSQSSHLYADDQQIYRDVGPGLESTGVTHLADCFLDLTGWCASQLIQLNATAALSTLVQKLWNQSKIDRDLGVLLDLDVFQLPPLCNFRTFSRNMQLSIMIKPRLVS